jgi:hypothetical protein
VFCISYPWLILIGEFVVSTTLFAMAVCRLVKSRNQELDDIDSLPTPRKQYDIPYYLKCHEDLRSFKTRQWNVVYYVVLVFGGIFGLEALITHSPKYRPYVLWILSAIALAVAYYGSYLVVHLQYSLRNTRIKLTKTMIFAQEIPLGKREDHIRNDREFWRDSFITIGFIITVVVGLLFVMLRLWVGVIWIDC